MVIEVVRFATADGVEVAQVLDAEAKVHRSMLSTCRGLRRRTVGQRDGSWIAVNLWVDDAAANQESAVRAVEPLQALLDPSSLSVERFDDLGG